MDLDKYLKTITNLNKYISFTADVQNSSIDLKVPFNISTILSLKDLRSIEIEYFNKCEENGGATKIVELLLRSPASKTWSLLGGELVNLFQYWLDAIRKHLIIHNVQWWTFLKLILKFIKEISSKDLSLNKILIEGTAECLLDLATHNAPNATQRNKIIQTFNAVSAETSRGIRLAYKGKLQEYFIKLSTLLASAGDLPLQHRMLETLLRWLLPRHELAVRRAAAGRWFPIGLYSRCAVEIFLERSWQDFMKDARDFLNAQNQCGDWVTSVICKTFSAGNRVCFSSKYKNVCWLDLNASTKCLSILIDPREWDALDGEGSHDTLLICDDNTSHVELSLVSRQVVISATVHELSRVYMFARDVIGDTNCSSDVHICVSSRSDIPRLDKALRWIFGEKYKRSLDVESISLCLSPVDRLTNSNVIKDTVEDVRFSMPPEVRRSKHSGYIVRYRNTGSWNSPSTVSTSSIAQLHEKLAALPRYTFDKEPVSVCALPQLSTVLEISETEENQVYHSSLSSSKCKRYGVCYKRNNKTDSKTSHSTSDDSIEKRNLSPIVNNDENSISCLLLATIGSTDDSIISDTIGRLPKNIPCTTDNIVDLLAQEALEGNTARQDFGVNVGDNREALDIQLNNYVQTAIRVCENEKFTQVLQENTLPSEQRHTDQSSNEVVENTPFSWVQVERPKCRIDKNISKSNADGIKLIHNTEAVEIFFSQHVTENRNAEIVISPSLARKINETSSECSDDLDQCILKEKLSRKYIVQDIEIDHLLKSDTDIVECVNAMVDNVCQALDKFTNKIDLVDEIREVNINPLAKRALRRSTRTKVVEESDTDDYNNDFKDKVFNSKRTLNSSKLKSASTKSITHKKTLKNTNKPKKEQLFTIMSPIIEKESIIDDSIPKNIDCIIESPKSALTLPLLRRKRKLYSPKSETCHEKSDVHVIETIDDSSKKLNSNVSSKASISVATSYKELEQERKNRIRKPRNRLSLKKPGMSVSPRTLKMNQVFDSLKDVIDGEPVKLADKMQLRNNMAVYNYTSDSEDDDENKTKSRSVLKKGFSPTKDSTKTETIGGRSSKQRSKSIKTIDTNKINKKSVGSTRKLRTKKPLKREKDNAIKISQQCKRNLEDEHMRGEAPEILNTSVVIEPTKDLEKSPNKHIDPVLNVVPQIECIIEDNFKLEDQNMKEQKCKTKRILSLKRNKDTPKVNLDINMADNDGTISPLPGLVVETVLTTEFDVNDSVSANMYQKFKDIYQGKPITDSEVNTTQNLLSDVNEPINYSPFNLNITEELNRENVKEHSGSGNKRTKKTNTTKKNVKKLETVKVKVETKSQIANSLTYKQPVVTPLTVTEVNSERSMATMGNSHSPITGHGDFDEDPPNASLLSKNIQPRIVEQEYLNQSIKNFFAKLTEQLNESNSQDDIKSIKEDPLIIDDRSSINSGSSNSPVVLITRLSPEYIRSRVSINSSIDYTNNSKTNNNFVSSSKICKDNVSKNKGDFNVHVNIKESDKTATKTTRAKVKKSTISPVKLSDDFKLIAAKTISSPCLESEDNCVKRIFSNKHQIALQPNQAPIAIRKSPSVTRSNTATSKHEQEYAREESTSSKGSVDSTKALKRKSSPILGSLKKFKYGEENNNFGSTIIESGPSMSSVDEWFKKNEPAYTEDIIISPIKESLKNVLEKLDTTLVEIHHNTSKRFINMFVDATAQLNDLNAKREQLHRQTAADIMASVVKIVDEKFLDLNNRLQSIDDQFMETLKKQAHNLIGEECKQKRAMVKILREDVQSVLNYLEKPRGSH